MPDSAEMRVLADENQVRFGLGNCPLAVDGTSIKLANKPTKEELPEGHVQQDFWARKMVAIQ